MVIPQEIVTLEQLFERESLILMDTGVQNRKGDWYAESIYPHKHFAEMDSDSLNWTLSEFLTMKSTIRQPNVFTVEPVVEELIRFEGKLKEKLTYLSKIYSNLKRNFKKTDKHFEAMDLVQARYNQEILEDICFAMNRIERYAKRKIISNVNDERFIAIAERAYRIADSPGIKIDYGDRYNKIVREKFEDLHADEELVANSIYLAAISGKPNAIFTGDSDIYRITNALIINLNREERWKGLTRLLEDIPIKIYFSDSQNTIRLLYDTSKPETYF